MARFKMTLEYEGTRYSGWQVQKNARTVQGEIIGALKNILQTEEFEIMGSGRTDAGVHALGQVAHIEAQTVLAPHILRLKINDLLPADINILSVEKSHPQFHARHSATSRTYLYQIATRRTAFGKRYVWWIKDSLDFELMKSAAKEFEGMHDFRSFTRDNPDDKSTKVQVESIRVEMQGSLILIRVTASHFLWNMVRQIVGMLVEVGRGNIKAEQIRLYLRTFSLEPRQYTASPSGLFLERVTFKGEQTNSPVQGSLINVP